MLHDQFPEEEGLKHAANGDVIFATKLHDQFPEEEGLKHHDHEVLVVQAAFFMTSFQRKKD